jgi:signal transduction histidine kinase
VVWLDLSSLLILASGTVIGGGMLGFDQWRRRKVPVDRVQEALDGLFTQQSQPEFWHYLETQVGPRVGVSAWLWVRRTRHDAWEIVERTSAARPVWLDDPNLHALLTTESLSQPRSTTVDRTALPSVLVVLPIYRDEHLSEALIAANPTDLRQGIDLERNLAISSRLMNAVHVLRRREDEQNIAQQNAAIAAQMRDLADAFRQITRRQRETMFQANRRFSTLLHDESLAELARLQERIRQTSAVLPEQHASLHELDEQCRAIGQNLRRIAHELRPAGVKQRLRYTLEHTVMEWEQQHPSVRFVYEFTADEYDLDEYQRDTIYLIISQLASNALRHANATTIHIEVYDEEAHIVCHVRDNGQGFDFDPERLPPDALGIRQRYDMAQELGGALTIETQPGAGCRVTLTIPRPEPPAS